MTRQSRPIIEDQTHCIIQRTLVASSGLEESKAQNISEVPTATLTEAMLIASAKDRIALQYVTNYKDIFTFSVLRYNDACVKYDDRVWTAVPVYTGLLRRFPDSHIERKYGNKYSEWVFKQMITVDNALANTHRPEQCVPLLHKVDRIFKDKGINPGTTADLTVATVFIHLLEALSVRRAR